MSCYLLAGGRSNPSDDFSEKGELTQLEATYRRYAAIFESVKLVIKKDQAKEHYLNYPHVIDESDNRHFAIGIETALKDARAEAVFVGSSDFHNFPLDLPVHLVKSYEGESFLGFSESSLNNDNQHLFGIYSTEMLPDIIKVAQLPNDKGSDVIRSQGKFISVPESAISATSKAE